MTYETNCKLYLGSGAERLKWKIPRKPRLRRLWFLHEDLTDSKIKEGGRIGKIQGPAEFKSDIPHRMAYLDNTVIIDKLFG